MFLPNLIDSIPCHWGPIILLCVQTYYFSLYQSSKTVNSQWNRNGCDLWIRNVHAPNSTGTVATQICTGIIRRPFPDSPPYSCNVPQQPGCRWCSLPLCHYCLERLSPISQLWQSSQVDCTICSQAAVVRYKNICTALHFPRRWRWVWKGSPDNTSANLSSNSTSWIWNMNISNSYITTYSTPLAVYSFWWSV